MTVISTEDVTKRYGGVTALEDVSLEVGEEIVGLLGENGAGKTTLFELLIGLDRPDEGHISVAGRDPTVGTAVRERIGYLPENASFPGTLTGREVVRFHARVRDVPAARRDRRVDQVLGIVGLQDAADRAVSGYSNGMNRRLGLATAIVADPDVLLLDEPTAGLDPLGVDRFHGIVERLTDGRELTVLLTSHALEEVERLCDRVAVIHDGRLAMDESVAELQAQGESTIVRATFETPRNAADAADRIRSSDGVVAVDQHQSRLEIDCEDAYAIVELLHETSSPTEFEVRNRGLSRAFEAAVGGESA